MFISTKYSALRCVTANRTVTGKKKVPQCFIEVAETLQRTWAKSGRLTFISLNDSVPLVKVGWKVIECNRVLRTLRNRRGQLKPHWYESL